MEPHYIYHIQCFERYSTNMPLVIMQNNDVQIMHCIDLQPKPAYTKTHISAIMKHTIIIGNTRPF